MFLTTYESRRKKILQTTINQYVQTGRPVSSDSVARQLRGNLSSATVRNYMKELENQGLLEQPHTSAGRIPTDCGYRFYIDSIMEKRYLTQREIQFIENEFVKKIRRLDEVLEAASKILSQLTSQISVILPPLLKTSVFKRMELFSIGKKQALVVLVSDSGLIKDSVIDFNEDTDEANLQKISRFLNSNCCGLPVDEVEDFLNRKLLEEKNILFGLLKRAIDILHLSYLEEQENRLFFEGTNYILEKPEFRDVDKLKLILEALNTQNFIQEILTKDLQKKGVNVRIGRENQYENLQDCSLITSTYRVGLRQIGALGIIGPKRMEYPKIIAIVNFIAERIGDIFERQTT